MKVTLFSRRSIWRPSLTVIYSGITPYAGRGYDTISTSSLYDPTRLKTDSGVLFLWSLFAGGMPDRWTIEFYLYVLSASRLVTRLCKFLRFILCITVIWCVYDDLVSDLAKQILERHEKIDRKEDGAAVWTNEMTFRQQTD